MDFLDLAKKRWACRTYSDRKIDDQTLAKILEAGRIAPTAANRQSQRIVVVRSPKDLEKLTHCTRDFKAPCALIVCTDSSESWVRKYDQMNAGVIDATIVTDHMMLQAADLGVDSLWVCMFKPEAVRQEFELPDHIVPVNILILGYSSEAATSPERHATTRKRLEDTLL